MRGKWVIQITSSIRSWRAEFSPPSPPLCPSYLSNHQSKEGRGGETRANSDGIGKTALLQMLFLPSVEDCTDLICVLLQVSWLRGSDSQVLSTGYHKFTGDRRVKVIPAERSHTWSLEIK